MLPCSAENPMAILYSSSSEFQLDDNINAVTAAVELTELLAITKKPKPIAHTLKASHGDDNHEEMEGDYHLKSWV